MGLNEALSILGLKYEFTEQDLKSAYRKMARKYHPDIIGDASNEKMSQINTAYEICRAQLGKMSNTKPGSGIWNDFMEKYNQMFEQTFSNIDSVYEKMFQDKFAEFDAAYNQQKTRY